MQAGTGDYRTRRKATGKFYAAPAATPTKLSDFGSVLSFKDNPKLTRAQLAQAAKGYVQVVHEEVGEADLRTTIKLDEITDEIMKLMTLSSSASATNQSSSNSGTATLTPVDAGYTYYIGAMGLSTLVVALSSNHSTVYTLGTDYNVDLGSGMLSIIPGGGIGAAASLYLTFHQAAINFNQFTALTQTFYRCYAKLVSFDQNSTIPREVKQGNAEIMVTDWGDNDGKKYQDVTVEVLWTDMPTTLSQQLA